MTTATLTTATAIHTRAILVCLTLSAWSARKYDKTATADVNHTHYADTSTARVNKFLFPGDCDAYKRVMTLLGALRTWHYSQTLAWSDDNRRLLPVANYTDYMTEYRKQTREIENALQAFYADYPTMHANAYRVLGGTKGFRSDDYPSLDALQRKFAYDVAFNPVPAQGDIRVDLGADQIAELESAILDRQSSAIKIATADTWSRLYQAVARIREKLSSADAIFRDSLIENAVELCDLLPKLNVMNDPDLAAMADRVRTELTSFTPDTLRKDDKARKDTAQQADSILSAMSAFYQAD